MNNKVKKNTINIKSDSKDINAFYSNEYKINDIENINNNIINDDSYDQQKHLLTIKKLLNNDGSNNIFFGLCNKDYFQNINLKGI